MKEWNVLRGMAIKTIPAKEAKLIYVTAMMRLQDQEIVPETKIILSELYRNKPELIEKDQSWFALETLFCKRQ